MSLVCACLMGLWKHAWNACDSDVTGEKVVLEGESQNGTHEGNSVYLEQMHLFLFIKYTSLLWEGCKL